MDKSKNSNNNSKVPNNNYNPPINNRVQVLPEYDINQQYPKKNVVSHWAPKSKQQQTEQMQVEEGEAEYENNNNGYNQNNQCQNYSNGQNNTRHDNRKSKEVGYIYIPDKDTKLKLDNLASPLQGGTNYIFWYSKIDPLMWGLTIKQVPENEEDEGFSSQHTWKATWFNKGDFLKAAKHCESIAKDIVDTPENDNYTQIASIYKSYTRSKNKNKNKNKKTCYN
jgi:hypothetical protein